MPPPLPVDSKLRGRRRTQASTSVVEAIQRGENHWKPSSPCALTARSLHTVCHSFFVRRSQGPARLDKGPCRPGCTLA